MILSNINNEPYHKYRIHTTFNLPENQNHGTY